MVGKGPFIAKFLTRSAMDVYAVRLCRRCHRKTESRFVISVQASRADALRKRKKRASVPFFHVASRTSEKRSVSNLIEVMADERWERLAEQQGVAYAKTVAEAMNLKLDMGNPADREKLRNSNLGRLAQW